MGMLCWQRSSICYQPGGNRSGPAMRREATVAAVWPPDGSRIETRIETALTLHPSYHLRAPFLPFLWSPNPCLVGHLVRLGFLPHPTAD